jgi:hypothetical protein
LARLESLNRRHAYPQDYAGRARRWKPNQHLLRDLQSSRHESQSEIPLRIAEAAQDRSSRRYHAGVPLPTVTQELGHKPLAATEDYLVHVKKAEAKRAVADADFIPKLKVQDCKDEY